ncbi:hypothetical protein NUW54_g12943 [Trametes sanguinea]|uniref:Uncharacterized protein n=1 Tax=Trametes sanguinea TaxID=158606 RepID=A0ACC1MTJ5_9APHY|nr:hypothetical protein NUW54_g12943 [Trametes sanguinea]
MKEISAGTPRNVPWPARIPHTVFAQRPCDLRDLKAAIAVPASVDVATVDVEDERQMRVRGARARAQVQALPQMEGSVI